MKTLNYILEKEDLENIDINDVDIDDEDIAGFLKENPDEAKKIVKQIEDDKDMSDEEKKKALDALKKILNESIVLEGKGYKRAFFLGGGIPGVVVHAIVRGSIKHSIKKTEKRLTDQAKNETDPDKKKEIEDNLHNYLVAHRDEKGNILCGKKAIKKNIDRLKVEKSIPDTFSYDDLKTIKKESKQSKPKDEKDKDEETVKDKDGVEWIKRKKERGDDFTYCRKDDRKVTMSQEEYAKHNAKKNESLNKSLKDFITENLNK